MLALRGTAKEKQIRLEGVSCCHGAEDRRKLLEHVEPFNSLPSFTRADVDNNAHKSAGTDTLCVFKQARFYFIGAYKEWFLLVIGI